MRGKCPHSTRLLIGYTGSKQEAQEIKEHVEEFLWKTLRLEVSKQKTRIVHASKRVRFLGYDLRTICTDKMATYRKNGRLCRKRSVRKLIRLYVPTSIPAEYCKKRGYGDYYINQPKVRSNLIHRPDSWIVLQHNAEMRGIANYYRLAADVRFQLKRLSYMAIYSTLKTLTAKRNSKLGKLIPRLKHGKEFVLPAHPKENRYSIPFYNLKDLVRTPSFQQQVDLHTKIGDPRKGWELITRFRKGVCELCAKTSGYMEVHVVRNLHEVEQGNTPWETKMWQMKRKTLVTCGKCHKAIHGQNFPKTLVTAC